MTKAEIRELILENKLELFGQPKWSVGKNTCNTYEVFVEKILLPSGEEMPAREIIEQIEADAELTEIFSGWFLKAAIASAQQITQKTNVNITLSMNVLPLYCNRRDFVQQMQEALLTTGFRPDKLHLELSESQELTQRGIANLNHLHNELGIGLWLGNFGVGHSNIALLSKLDVDGIETDRFFAAEAQKSEKAAKLLVAIAHFADTMDIKVCAKGVETEDQMQFFEDYGYFKIQGYFIGMPMKLSEMEEYIRSYGKGRQA